MNLLKVLGEVVYALQNSKFGDKFVLKGGLSLMSAMYTLDKSELFRDTTDIDLDYFTLESWEDLIVEIESILNFESKLGLTYQMVKRRGFEKNPNGDSISFTATDGSEQFNFKIDMNVVAGKALSVYKLPFLDYDVKAVSLINMIKDKMTVLCSDKIFRRVKDVYDLYALSYLSKYNSSDILPYLVNIDSEKSVFNEDLDQLEHAFSRFRGIRRKPDFCVMVERVRFFVNPLLEGQEYLIWNPEKGVWGIDRGSHKLDLF